MNTQTISQTVTFTVEQNEIFGDFRVMKYVNGEWLNLREGNWTKRQADVKAQEYRELTANGFTTMSDNV
jgi:hypothetical protein